MNKRVLIRLVLLVSLVVMSCAVARDVIESGHPIYRLVVVDKNVLQMEITECKDSTVVKFVKELRYYGDYHFSSPLNVYCYLLKGPISGILVYDSGTRSNIWLEVGTKLYFMDIDK